MAPSGKTTTWMPFYVGDYLRDTGRLTTENHGAYLLLIFDYWTSRSPLPDDDDQLAAIARLPVARWQKARKVIANYFTVADGVWRHKRIDAEIERANIISKARQDAGKRGGNAKAIATSQPEQTPKQNPTPSPSQSPSEDKSSGADAPPPAVVDPWKAIYEGFKRHLGTKAGGLVSKLRQCSGEVEMANWLAQLDRGEIADAREYFGRIVAGRDGPPPPEKPDPVRALRDKVECWRKYHKPLASYDIKEAVKAGLMTEDEARAA